jgi:hypothetical protein
MPVLLFGYANYKLLCAISQDYHLEKILLLNGLQTEPGDCVEEKIFCSCQEPNRDSPTDLPTGLLLYQLSYHFLAFENLSTLPHINCYLCNLVNKANLVHSFS